MKSRKYEAPVLPRATDWSDERLARLTSPELKALQANAERLQEDDIAARCRQALKKVKALERKAPPPPARKPARA